MKKICVVGAGVMGSGITQVCAQAGFEVNLYDIKQEFVEKGLNTIKGNLKRSVEKGRISQEEADKILEKIVTTTNLKEAVKEVDFVIEAAPENMEIKRQVFKDLDNFSPKHAILASNTSSLSITEIASVTSRPDKVVGMHFFNPAPVMKLVEVVKGQLTSEETITTVKDLAKKLGKTPVECKDSPGFIANRICIPMINEAITVLQEGIASKEDIDLAVKLGYNHPMGPLELADLIGLDTLLAIMETYYKEFNDPKYKPALLLKQMVRAGLLGRKTGKGFYSY
ncbi:MAG: 3-hydroxybutyryl-CoA dehydrogenase, partial [Candidatus Bathyarchaeota archaeon]|nr:3-hydroxybutyryl-CoA dehydrogenase [Candidatus Bathyarchaeota archaeon]